MKPYMRGIASIVLGTFLVLGVSTSSVNAETCGDVTMGNTGPGSHNSVDCEESNVVRAECVNNIYVKVNNDQDADTGDSETEGNTTGGNTTTGNAVNENGTSVQLGASCETAAAPVAEKPNPPAKPSANPKPGMGAAGPVDQPVARGQAVAMLPNTASNSLATNAAIGVASLIGLLAVSQLSLAGYRQLTSK